MKRIFITVFVFATIVVQAQEKGNYYWVVEGNLNHPRSFVIHYYNDQHLQIGEERWEGKPLDISKKKRVRYLNRRLQEISNQPIVWQYKKERKYRR